VPKVIQVLGSSPFGGGTRIVFSLARYLIDKGFETLLLSNDLTTKIEAEKKAIPIVNLHPFVLKINPYYDTFTLKNLYFLFKREKPVIVHTHTSKAGFLGRVAAKLAGVPVIIHTIHGFAFHEFSSRLNIKFYSSLERIASLYCDNLVSVNASDLEWAIRLKIVHREKIITIYNGIPIPNLNKGEINKQLIGIKDNNFLITCLGRLAPQKGLEFLLKALKNISERFNNICLAIIGDGPQRNHLELLTQKLDLSDKVFFLGFRKDVYHILAASDIYALPSLWEGLSISLLEAMSIGLPIIATNIKGNNEVLKDGYNGLLIAPGDSDSITKAISELYLDKEKRYILGIRAQETVKTLFSEDRMLKEYFNLYKELLTKKGLL